MLISVIPRRDTPVAPLAPPMFSVRALSPMTMLTLANDTSSSSATICAMEVASPWPPSIAP